tara:strand:+ start:549 stop:716 length:168 start_codon:yes stop_codon:yes gene_type:complete
MQPWIIQKIREHHRERKPEKRVQPQLPVPEPLHQIAPPKTTDGEEVGIVTVDFEL